MHPLHSFFEPRRVAIVGGSSDPEKLSGKPIRFLKAAGFAGGLVAVNARSSDIQGLPTYPSVDAIEGEVDQAIIVVPAAAVAQAVEDCGRKGIKALQVFTAGFAELGIDGAREQERLVTIARSHGMRLLGPNCLGIVSVRNRFFATFSTALDAMTPSAGVIGLATQSGAFGSCAYATAIQRGIGLSRIVATGNECDIDVAECIGYLAQDPQTQVICAAIEGCKDGPGLRRALLGAARAGKPVVMMKVGTTELGAAAAATHTGSLAGNDAVFETVFAECGAWRANSIEEMLDIASLCAVGPLPANTRAGIVTLSGGVGVLMADAWVLRGLELPSLSAQAGEQIAQIVPFATLGNPMDTTAQVAAVRDGLVRVLEATLEGTDWGTVFVYLAQKAASPARFESTLASLARLRQAHPDRCIVLVGPSDPGVRQALEARGLVMMTDPSRAVAAAAAAAVLHARRRGLDAAVIPPAQQVRTLPFHPLPAVLDESSAKALLAAYGIPVLVEQVCRDVEAAVAAARDLGYPVVAKIASPDIAHKTEVGGIALNLCDEAALRVAVAEIFARVRAAAPSARLDGVLIAPMALSGVETILGLHRDPVFGPMLMLGLGGVAVELFKDVVFASAPVTPARARQMIAALRSAPLLTGWRGGPAMDVAALADALCCLSNFALDHRSDVDGAEINPFLLRQKGGVCLDALVNRSIDPAPA